MTDSAIKIIALTTAAIATAMPIFEAPVKEYLIKRFQKHEKNIKRTWYILFLCFVIIAWWTGIETINREQQKSDQSEKDNKNAWKKAYEALESENIEHKRDDIKIDNRHTNDSTYYTKQNNVLVGFINGLIKTQNRTFDTATQTIKAVQKIKNIPPVEPYLDLDYSDSINPAINYRNDSALFKMTIINSMEESPAKNIVFLCFFINPKTNQIYLGQFIVNWNKNIDLKKGDEATLFTCSLIKNLPNAFYVFIRVSYTDINGKNQSLFERIYVRNNKNKGEKCANASNESFDKYKNLIYTKFPELK